MPTRTARFAPALLVTLMGASTDIGQVTLRSVDQRPGDSITFIFAGTLANGIIAGPIHLGEYLTARFTARRHAYTTAHTRIRVPTGPPLAT